MARFFVSYSRSTKATVSEIVTLLRASGHDVWWDGDIPVIADWWATILTKIEWCEVFIFVASIKSVESPYCLEELRYAADRQRPVLPLMLDDPTSMALPADLPPRGQWLVSDGDPANLLHAINRAYANINWVLHKDIPAPRPAEPAKGGKSLARQFQEARKLANAQEFSKARQILIDIKRLDYGEWGQDCDEWLARIISYAALIDLAADDTTLDKARAEWREHTRQHGDAFDPAGIREHVSVRRPRSSGGKGTRLPLTAIMAGVAALAAVIVIVLVATNAAGPRPGDLSPTPTQSGENTAAAALPSPTLSSFEQLQTAQIQLTESVVTQAAADLNATQDTILNSNATETAQQIMATETAAQVTLLALSWTPTPRPTDTPVPPTFTPTPPPPTPTPTPVPLDAALDAARAFTGSNADWQARYPDGFQQTFEDGVKMVLVPAGCFMMGSNDGGDDEQPVNEQCFDEPFWIDLTEVTQVDFERFGGRKANPNSFDGNQRPVENITWFEARDFCALRGMRLPTEREWEYAARGPDALVYPWENKRSENNAVWNRSSSKGTADVAGIEAGRSWVGAYDLSGNVREWTSSLYLPYSSMENREADSGNRMDVSRVLRGGSWDVDDAAILRSTFRVGFTPDIVGDFLGFRCARSS